ncbi:extracellular solute-binding protein [Nitratireductor sp. XY-223]|uniref:ABC transporter substrate-binding protein n=1 Tax=Nitratireductor sp. XY-223 TaxID=2561926 RepID=UPI0010AB14C8|nr:extracellular solute-binding protein [Nitratireductor sp. XY-223]
MKLRSLMITAATAVLAAGVAKAEPVKLTVWSDTARIEPFKAFDAAHDNIELEIVTVAPPDQTAKLQLAMRSGDDVPDAIFMAELQQIAQLSTRRSNYLMDISDKIDQSVVDSFLPNALSPCQSGDGRLLCLRNDLAHFIAWYNKPKFDELGLSVPTTWEEFEEIGKLAAENGLIVGSGTQPTPVLNMLIAGGCEPGFLVEGSDDTIRVDFTSEGCIAAAAMVDRMRENGSLSPHGPFEPSFVTDVQEGKLLMFNGPTWFGEHVMRPLYKMDAGILAASESLKWKGQAQPQAWSWGGGVFGGYRDTEHPDEVVELIRWMTTDTGLQGRATTMPAHAESSSVWRDRVANDPWYAQNDVYDKMETSAQYGHPSYGGYRFDIMAAFSKIDGASNASIVDKLPDYAAEIENSAKVAGYKIAN